MSLFAATRPLSCYSFSQIALVEAQQQQFQIPMRLLNSINFPVSPPKILYAMLRWCEFKPTRWINNAIFRVKSLYFFRAIFFASVHSLLIRVATFRWLVVGVDRAVVSVYNKWSVNAAATEAMFHGWSHWLVGENNKMKMFYCFKVRRLKFNKTLLKC